MTSPASTATRTGLDRPAFAISAPRVLNWACRLWYGMLVAGQLLFVAYLLGFYGRHAAQGQLAAWNKVVPHAYRTGDTVGNLAMAMHVGLAALVIGGGMLQLLPWLRNRMPALHRWNGRLYVVGALAASTAGLYMVWIRGSVGDLGQHIGLTLDAVLIWAFAFLAVRAAWQRRMTDHRRWALRLFIAVSGVWFYRVGLMFWILVNGGPAGFDPDSFTGPFLTVLAFADYLLPLAALELYLLAQRAGSRLQLGAAVTIAGLSLVMAAGGAVAAMGMWLPRLGG